MESWKLDRTNVDYKKLPLRIFLFPFFALLMLSSCVNYLQEADTAYEREDWDSAVQNYTYALSGSKDSAEIERIKRNLVGAKQQGALNHLEKAYQLERIGEVNRAYQHAIRAYTYQPTAKTEVALNRLKNKEVDRLISLGQASLDSGSWEAATRHLTQANGIQASERVSALLLEATEGQNWEVGEKFSQLSKLGHDALTNRNWSLAVQQYQAAHQYSSTPTTKHELDFASLLANAEQRIARSNSVYAVNQAEGLLTKALSYGIDKEYVSNRIEDIKLRDYKITIHSAVILPFDPADNTRWDGLPGETIDPVAELASIGAAFYGVPPSYAKIGTSVLKLSGEGIYPPDPVLLISFSGNQYGDAETRVNNQFRPQWEYSLTFPDINKHDKRVISLSVFDIDITEHDKIGDYQFVLGELVATGGVIEKVFIDENQKLLAGGLAGLKLSVVEL